MIADHRLVGLVLLGLQILNVHEQSTFGQTDVLPNQSEVEEDEPSSAVVVIPQPAQNMRVNLETYYERRFGEWLSIRPEFEARLKIQISQTCKAYQLSEMHKRKLKIAGLADILSFQEDARKLHVMHRELEPDQDHSQTMRDEFLRLSLVERNFPFRSDESLYVKVLNRILITERITPRAIVFLDDPAAIDALEEVEYYSSLVGVVESALPGIALRDKKQRVQLAEMLRQELQTKPRLNIEETKQVWQSLAQIPPERWNQILDERQWTGLKVKFSK